MSPDSTKIGTWTTSPVSVVAGLRAPGLRVAGEAGLGVDHLEVDRDRQLDADRLALVARAVEGHPVLEVLGGLAELVGGEHELVVRVGVHEVVLVAVAVQELDRPLLHRGPRPLRPGLERALHGLAALDVAQRDPHLGRAATHLDVVVVEDLPELAVELDGDALLQFAGADHRVGSWGDGRGSSWQRRAHRRGRSTGFESRL